MPGLPRAAVLGLNAAGTAATITLADGGLIVTAFSDGPTPPPSLAELATHGLTDRVVAVTPNTLRLVGAATHGPPFEVHGGPHPGNEARPGDAAHPLGVFEAVVLTGPAARLGPAGTGSARFGEVFDLEVPWLFHVAGPAQLAAAQARWIGEYLRGRYTPPSPDEMAARPRLAGRSLRGGAHGQLASLDRELRAGHARAAEAGYPMPQPPGTTLNPG
ncbi:MULTISPECIES: hypothetical protein [unclassified Frankia]